MAPAARKLAMMVSANSAIWMPAEPMVAGPSAWKKRLTS